MSKCEITIVECNFSLFQNYFKSGIMYVGKDLDINDWILDKVIKNNMFCLSLINLLNKLLEEANPFPNAFDQSDNIIL